MRILCVVVLVACAPALLAGVPSVSIDQAAAQADPTTASPILFTVSFSESVTGFTGVDVSFAGSTVGGTLQASVSGSGSSYTVSVTGMVGSGNVITNIPAGGCLSVSTSQANTASSSFDNQVTYNDLAPGVTIEQAAAQADPATTTPILFDVNFSESVTGFTSADISFSGSTAGGTLTANVTGSGAVYTVEVSGMVGNGVVVVSIPAAAAQDSAGQNNTAATSTDNQVSYTDLPPTVTIDQAVAQADPATTSPIVFDVNFSESVTGFTGADISFSGSTVGGTLLANVTGSGAVYAVQVSGMVGNGVVVVSIPAAAAQDSAGQNNTIATSTDNQVAYTDSPPTVTIDQASAQADPTAVTPILFSVVFSEPVTGFTAGDISFAGSTVGGTLVASISGSGPDYTVSVTGMKTPGDVVVSIPAAAALDLFSQPNTTSTSTDNTVSWIGSGSTGGKGDNDKKDDDGCSTSERRGGWMLALLLAATSLLLRRRRAF